MLKRFAQTLFGKPPIKEAAPVPQPPEPPPPTFTKIPPHQIALLSERYGRDFKHWLDSFYGRRSNTHEIVDTPLYRLTNMTRPVFLTDLFISPENWLETRHIRTLIFENTGAKFLIHQSLESQRILEEIHRQDRSLDKYLYIAIAFGIWSINEAIYDDTGRALIEAMENYTGRINVFRDEPFSSRIQGITSTIYRLHLDVAHQILPHITIRPVQIEDISRLRNDIGPTLKTTTEEEIGMWPYGRSQHHIVTVDFADPNPILRNQSPPTHPQDISKLLKG